MDAIDEYLFNTSKSKAKTAKEQTEFDHAMSEFRDRSKQAQIADLSKDAKIPDSILTWESDPSEYDWPGIDTPDSPNPWGKKK